MLELSVLGHVIAGMMVQCFLLMPPSLGKNGFPILTTLGTFSCILYKGAEVGGVVTAVVAPEARETGKKIA